MKLAIDYGNTMVKIGVFQGQQLIGLDSFRSLTEDHLEHLFDHYKNSTKESSQIKYSIISSVISYPKKIREFLESRTEFVELSHNTPIPLIIRYSTPETLGNDRIALTVGASHVYPENDVLIIDAGTCITYDFVNKDGEYFGGAISAGITMRFKALNTFTGKLPLVSDIEKAELIGNSTINSIKSGVLNGVIAEVDGIIDRYKEKFPNLKVVFTGGNLNYFDKSLKNNIFANSNLLLDGLNVILDYNVEDKLD